MAVPVEVITGPRLKIERAKCHIDELIAATNPLSDDLFTIKAEPKIRPPHSHAQGWQLTYRPIKPIPETLGLIIGDAVHNLRAALDHLASGVIRTKDAKANPYFPVTKSREHLVTSGWLKAIEEALPGSEDLILKKIRPENDGRDKLWRVGSLDIEDKHNLITPSVVVTNIELVGRCLVATNEFHGGTFSNDATRTFYLVATDGAPIEVDGQFNVTASVSFREGDLLKDEPIVPTLTQMAELFSYTIDEFEKLIRKRL